MADTSVDWTVGGLNNPLIIQEKILDRFEEDTGKVVVDANNPACVLMEAFASTAAGIVRTIEDTVRPAIYPKRANTSYDLYKHLSDSDYVDIFSSPASTKIQLVMDKIYVRNNSLEVSGQTYKKLVIPSTTTFTIGDHTFGLYYPIEIRSNSKTGKFTVVYDTSESNPMKTMTSNVLEYYTRYYKGRELAFVMVPVYQFEKTVVSEVLVTGNGFKKSIPYTNKFYAIRCYAETLQNYGHDSSEEDVWETTELSLCASGQSYDVTTPTVVFTPDLENSECIVEIPYVYFSQGMIRGELRIELYTTEGAINYSIPETSSEVCTVDMFSAITDDNVYKYAAPFKTMPSLQVMPLSVTIVGGSDGMTFEDLRDRVVTGSVRSKTLQTPDDIDAYFATQGYITTMFRDGITDRIFIAHAPVKNTSDEVVSADSIGTMFDFRSSSIENYDTVVSESDDVFTILPSTIYKLDTDKGVCYPLTSTERSALKALAPGEKVTAFNENIYTMSPFYLQIDKSSKYPTTVTYDMTDIFVITHEFVAEREGVTGQLILDSMTVSKFADDDTRDGYLLQLSVSRSELDDVQAVVDDTNNAGKKNFRVIMAMKNDDGTYYFGEAEYVGRTDDVDIFEYKIRTDYKFHQANNNHTVVLKTPLADTSSGEYQESDYFLTTEVRAILCQDGDINSVATSGPMIGCRPLETDFTNVATRILDSTTNYYAMSEYKLSVRFGSAVNELDQRINLAYSEMEYKKYDTTKFLTIDQPIYAKDANDVLIVDVNYQQTTDTEFKSGKDYYTRSGSEGSYVYTKATVTPGATITGTYYEKKVELTEKFPAGTMTCVTKTHEDSQTLNSHTVENYIGCHVSGRSSTITSSDVYTQLAIEDAPIVPRFKVTATKASVEGTSEGVATYEMYKAKEQKSYSLPTQLWYKTGADKATTATTEYGTNFSTADALQYVLRNMVFVYSDGSYTERSNHVHTNSTAIGAVVKYIDEFSAPKGTFFLINNDYSGSNDTCVWDDVPKINTITNENEPNTKLFYCYDYDSDTEKSSWVCVAQADNEATLYTTVDNSIAGTGGEKPKTYGYIYLLTVNTALSSSDQKFLSFLNTKTTTTDEVYPDFTCNVRDTWNDNVNDPVMLEQYGFWRNNVNKWPWDVSKWWLKTTTTNSTATYITVEEDSAFTIVFNNPDLNKYCEYVSGQYMLNDGQLIEDTTAPRYIQYLVDMLQIDAKMAQTTANSTSKAYPENVVSVLRGHFTNLGNARDSMFTNTRLFFEPIKSIGVAAFSTGDGKTEDIQMDVSVAFKIYVSQASANDDALMESVEKQIIDIIDDKIESSKGLNCAEIAQEILSSVGDTVIRLDILGINGDPTLQTIRCEDDEAVPHLKHQLVLLDDEATIDISRGLDLTVAVVDD